MAKTPLVPILFCVLSLTGCSVKDLRENLASSKLFTNARTALLDKLTAEETKDNALLAGKVVDAINAKDANALKDLFCEKSRSNLHDLDEQIAEFLRYYERGVRRFETQTRGENRSSDGGRITELSRSFKILVSEPADYDSALTVAYTKTYLKDPSRQGLTRLSVYPREGTKSLLRVGYEWQDYHKEAAALSYQAIKNLETGDYTALLGQFRAELRENAAVQKTLKANMGFISGKPLYGEKKDGTYDGRYDFHTEDTESEVVENGALVEVGLLARNSNIITDQGTVYSIDIHATRKAGEDSFAIDNMILRDGESNEVTIGR